MKKVLLYLLLFSYTCIICKPVLPALSDGLAHIFWYSQHMATVHYENGRYHVHNENLREARNGYPQHDTGIPKTVTMDTEHLVTITGYILITPSPVTINYFSSNTSALAHIYLNNNFPPPKA